MKSGDVPAVIILPEHMRRISEMNLGMNHDKGALLKMHTLLINANSKLVNNALRFNEGVNPDKAKLIAQHVYDLALISSKVMNEADMGNFLKRSSQILEDLTN